ncbi:small ribosomal subunit protein mS26 [Linepithema humile]|uniref:small ribosomal subunit protein mS26 n=1 Tax=Linepithema humile TaxID=83485 RepID=UPI0006231F68|nr:PREDICTED: probable 28S ribosomal protein S26, mitochondrial [Linepithema humile]
MMQAIKIMNASTLTISTTRLCESFIPNSVYTQCVRWKRKPIWLPTAKSKLYRVPKKRVIPEVDKQELQRLYNNYRTYMTSLRSYFVEVEERNRVQYDEATMKAAEEKDFEKCSAINDEWNTEVAKIREARLAKIKESKREIILQKLLKQEQRQEKQKKKIDERIRKAKQEAVTFITADNIDAAIEECLTNTVNHNRAMDLKGNWYEGKYLPDSPIEGTQIPAVAEQ